MYRVVGAGKHAHNVGKILSECGEQYSADVMTLENTLERLFRKEEHPKHIIAIADQELRQQAFDRVWANNGVIESFIHPTAVVSSHSTLGAGALVMPKAYVGPYSTLGDGVLVNTNSLVEHHCEVSDYVNLAPGSILCGTVRLGRKVSVGAGATVIEGVEIADFVSIGANACVVKSETSTGVTLTGIPARSKS